MTTLQTTSALQMLGTPDRQLRIDAALTLRARRAGWLVVDAGQVWITRQGEAVDHVLSAGQALQLGQGQQLVAEPWRAAQAAQLRWLAGAGAPEAASAVAAPARVQLPARRRGAAFGARAGWALVARGLRGAAAFLAAAARSAESRANVAQGRICIGDSIASSGALQ